MPIPEGHKTNLETIKMATRNDSVTLVEARDKETGEMVTLLCAVAFDHTTMDYIFTPMAQMFGDYNPYERFQAFPEEMAT